MRRIVKLVNEFISVFHGRQAPVPYFGSFLCFKCEEYVTLNIISAPFLSTFCKPVFEKYYQTLQYAEWTV